MTSVICTVGGRPFNFIQPASGDIDIREIAHALSNICRFTGHTREFYSVAQHSVLVTNQVENMPGWGDLTHNKRILIRRAALLHDVAEAYLGDVNTPLKSRLVGFRHMEQGLLADIYAEFGLDAGWAFDMPRIIKHADELLLQWERRDLMPHAEWFPTEHLPHLPTIKPMQPGLARAHFLDHFEALFA